MLKKILISISCLLFIFGQNHSKANYSLKFFPYYQTEWSEMMGGEIELMRQKGPLVYKSISIKTIEQNTELEKKEQSIGFGKTALLNVGKTKAFRKRKIELLKTSQKELKDKYSLEIQQSLGYEVQLLKFLAAGFEVGILKFGVTKNPKNLPNDSSEENQFSFNAKFFNSVKVFGKINF